MKNISPYILPGIELKIPDLKLSEEALPTILKVVEEVTGVPARELFNKNNKEQVVLARHLFCGVALKNTNCTHKVIAGFIKRERSTIGNSIDVLKDLIITDPVIKEQYQKVKHKLFLLYN